MKIRTLAVRLASPVVLLVVFGSTVDAAPPSFAPGETLSAAKLNGALAEADGRLTKIESRITAGGKIALAGLYCGATAAATKGDLSGLGGGQGYLGAKAACEATCNHSPTARICTGDDLVRSASLGMSMKNGWFAGGVAAQYRDNTASYGVTDCAGFTSGDGPGGLLGQDWTPAGPIYHWCNEEYALLCCDAP
jgi:hypothetical protein